MVRVHLASVVRRDPGVPVRLVEPLGVEEVERQQLDRLFLRGGGLGPQRVADPRVQVAAGPVREPGVRTVADDGVLEPPASRRVALEVLLDPPPHRGIDRRPRLDAPRRTRSSENELPRTASRRSSSRSGGWQPVDARGHERVDAVGEAGDVADVTGGRDQLGEEERVARRRARR